MKSSLKLVAETEVVFDENFIKDLRGLVWNSQSTSHKTWEELAADANLAQATVARFAHGYTTKPHHLTITKLIRALGYRFAVVPMNARRQPDEVDLRRYRSRIPGQSK